MLELTRQQMAQITLGEIEYQLTMMKQYISKEETEAYLLLLNRYGSLLDRERILERYHNAHPSKSMKGTWKVW